MSRHIAPGEGNPRRRRTTVAVAFAALGLAITGIGVYAGLQATASNAAAQTVTSGTLKLVYADNGVGFSQSILLMAPGDVVNRFVDLSNTGTLAGKNLTLGVADASSTKLTTDATNGLHVTVSSCTVAWVVAANTGTCAGTTTVLLNNAALSALVSSPSSLVSGAVASAYQLKISLTLPDQNEITTNGTLPVGTIQGLSASLTWSFNEAQRDAATTNS
jgi:hypothetical protein